MYVWMQLQLARDHRVILLSLMEKICKGHIESVSEDMADKLILLGSAELTMSAEVIPDWQKVASQLLSTLGICHARQVMKELLNKFQPGGNPHYFVIYTLGMLATANGRPDSPPPALYCHLKYFSCILLCDLFV